MCRWTDAAYWMSAAAAACSARALAEAGARVVGVDAGEESIEAAREHAADSGVSVEYHVATARALRETHAREFDAVVCMELLEHVPRPWELVDDCAAMLKPGGRVVFSTINRTLTAYLGAVVAAERLCSLLPAGTHDYRQFVRPSELADWCRKTRVWRCATYAGCVIGRVCGGRSCAAVRTSIISCWRRGERHEAGNRIV